MAKRIIPILLILGLAAYGGYRVIQRQTANGAHLLTGTVEATQVTVSAELNGRLLELGADEGDTIESGRLLARIDTATLDAQLKQAEAARISANGQYRSIEAGIKNVDANLNRSESLFTAGSLSEQNLDAVSTEKDVRTAQRTAALGQIKQAEATAELVQAQIDKATVVSPLAGTVLRRDVEVGEMAIPGAPLFTIADLVHPWVRVYIPETQLGRVKIGQKAKVYSDSFPGKLYVGHVTTIAGEAEFTPKNVQTKEERVRLVYAVKVSLENPNGELKIGMPVDVELD